MKYRTKLWTSISAAALIAASGAVAGMAPSSAGEGKGPHADAAPGKAASGTFLMAAAGEGEGEGGEGGDGGEGGEGGVDPATAAKDPAVYLSALDIIRAHYLAGEAMLDVEGGRQAGGEMFAHPISEVYIDLEPVFEARGAALFMDEMTEAVDLALGDAPEDEVKAAAGKVYAALDAAAEKAPASEKSAAAIEAALMAQMLDRAAKQYDTAIGPNGSEEAWIDGYGFWKVAEKRAKELKPALGEEHESLAGEIARAEELFAKAYASVEKPEAAPVEPGTLLAASSRISFKTSSF
ncbi:MAG: hypothetical protein CVT73_18230 [Alphaproteobacteria bacterium HGW-Alphaproteobacteria-12]|nr:MAG: hypothetical protein CVT73_18230 [Alphaproteobacteria bacterium HGW-Alphaproteobacteria-12]